MIGLSLSFCVRDIANGVVNIDDVEKIITGTKCATEDDWSFLTDEYNNSYWQDIKESAFEVLSYLRKDDKIYQPKLNGEIPPNISNGIWVEDEKSLAKERKCSACSRMERIMCPLEAEVIKYPESYRQPLVPTFYPETTPYQLGCFYFQKK